MPWGAVAGAVASTVVGSALADDHGAGAANQSATNATNQQAAIAQDQWDTYKSTYQPLEKQYVNQAQTFDSPEAYQRAAGDASATVSEQYSKARDRLTRTAGLDPSSAGYASSMAGLDMSQAAVDATQQNAARRKVQDTAWARKTDAISLGKGLPAQASSTLGAVSAADAARANAGLASANAQGASIGRLGEKIVGALGAPNTSPGLSDIQHQGLTDFATNYTPENYG